MPMLTDADAAETAGLMNARHERATGNHFTMLFGPGAAQITAAITDFLRPQRAGAG
jgi:hypothetical protein